MIASTPHELFLNTEDLASSRFSHVFALVRGLDERCQHILLVMMERCDMDQSKWKAYRAYAS
jgi:hypothetical protein